VSVRELRLVVTAEDFDAAVGPEGLQRTLFGDEPAS
jgi:hypothetical protein